jgi:hypothetical protein
MGCYEKKINKRAINDLFTFTFLKDVLKMACMLALAIQLHHELHRKHCFKSSSIAFSLMYKSG